MKKRLIFNYHCLVAAVDNNNLLLNINYSASSAFPAF